MIVLLCPTRARPEQCKRMIESAYRTADKIENKRQKDHVKVITSMSNEDFDVYQEFGCDSDYPVCSLVLPDGMPTAHKWNLLAEMALKDSDNKLFMLCADDVVFSTPCWEKALLDHYNALENKIHVYHLRDSRNEDGTPHPIFSREWIEFFGFMLPPIFLHFYVDTWSVEIAKYAGCFTHLKDYMLLHDKPSDRGQADETHSRIRQMGWVDRDKYVYEKCQHFLEFEKKRLTATILSQMSMDERTRSPLKSYGVM